jgi:hypothetical protein
MLPNNGDKDFYPSVLMSSGLGFFPEYWLNKYFRIESSFKIFIVQYVGGCFEEGSTGGSSYRVCCRVFCVVGRSTRVILVTRQLEEHYENHL